MYKLLESEYVGGSGVDTEVEGDLQLAIGDEIVFIYLAAVGP